MLTTKSLGSINELLVMEKLVSDMAKHASELTKDKNVQLLLSDVIKRSAENKKLYLQVLEGAK